MEIFWAIVVVAVVVVVTILANRIMKEMDEKGVPRGESLCAGNPNCPLRKLEDQDGEKKTEKD